MSLLMYLTMLAMYIVVGTLIAVISRRLGIRTVQDYYVAGYRLSGFLASMTYAATTYSAFMMIGLVGLSYATGVGALGFELAYFVATLTFLALFSKKVWSMARKRKWVSPAEMLSDLYGSKNTWHNCFTNILSSISTLHISSANRYWKIIRRHWWLRILCIWSTIRFNNNFCMDLHSRYLERCNNRYLPRLMDDHCIFSLHSLVIFNHVS